MEQRTIANLKEYVENLKTICDKLPFEDIAKMVDMLWTAVNNGKAIYTMGNGGHCNTASHMINDLAKHTTSSDDKKAVVADNLRFRAMCLNDSMSFITGIGNDMGFGSIFSEQAANWVQSGDVVIGISGSGNSENIIKAFRVAKSKGAATICLTGFNGGKSKDEADLCIIVPCNKMVTVEDFHLMINHMVADELKKLVQNREDVIG